MKLKYFPTSPYVRKVLVTAIETGLYERIELVPTNVWNPDTDIGNHNPLGKIPTLLTPGGEILYDSPVICEYLDSLHDGQKIYPPAGGVRWTALRQQALGDGMLDAAILRRLENARPDGERSDAWIGRQKIVVDRGLDVMEDEADALGETITIGLITFAITLSYLDFRFPDEPWRSTRPALADWYDAFSARPSMEETLPKDPA